MTTLPRTLQRSAHREPTDLVPFGRLLDDWMPLGRWPDPFGNGEVDRLLKPALDVSETESAYQVHAELPGVAKEDVTITLENNTLVITGEKKREEEQQGKGWHRVERSYGSFQRSITLPKGVDADKAEASFKDGVLTVQIPKSEKAKPKTLKVK